MKLRQKLAVVLAAATVVTAVPVVTHAASNNRVTKNITVVEGTEFTNHTTAPAIIIEAKDASNGEEFLLELENSEWLDWDEDAKSEIVLANTENAKVVILGPKTAKVEVAYGAGSTDDDIKIPLTVEVLKGVAKVHIEGGSSTISSDSHQFAATPGESEELLVSVGETKAVYEDGKIADIIIEEAISGSLVNGGEFKITLNHRDYEFIVPRGGQVELVGGKGFAGKTGLVADIEYGRYDNEVIIKLPKVTSSIKGTLKIKGLEVESTVREPREGDLTIDIEGDTVGKHRDLKVATVSTYGTAVDAEAEEAFAGQEATIKFNIKEKVADSLREGRTLEVVLDKGYFIEEQLDGKKYDEEATLNELARTIVKIKDGDTSIDLTDLEDVEPIVKSGKVIGFAFTVRDFDGLSFEANIQLPLDVEGDVKVVLEGRALDTNEAVSTPVLTVAKPFDVTVESSTVLSGVAKQKAGKIVITEKEDGMIKYGEKIEIVLPEEFRYTELPTVEVTAGDLEIGRIDLDKNDDGLPVLEIEVKRDSRLASTIEIKDFEMTVNGYAPNGDYGITVGGPALTTAGEGIEIEKFITVVDKIEEPEVEEIPNTASFVIGSTSYLVNGETKTMDVAPYISEKGNTMIPLRYVAAALGISEDSILWSGATQTATILDGDKIIQVQVGSNMAMLNGVSIPMNSATVMTEGRTCVPVGEIGRLLGAQVDWDQATKTASFTR